MRSQRRFLKIAAVAAIPALIAVGCSDDDEEGTSTGGTSAGGSASGEVVISGSSTVQPITSLVAEGFKAENPDVGISVDGPGTGDGFELFCAGETDISNASRPIKDEEAQACADAGIEYVELKVGIDGITVATSPANEAIECLDEQAIYAIVGPESTGFDTWAAANELAAEVGSEYTDLPDAPLTITGPGEESGTYDTFVELAITPTAETRVEEGKISEDEAESTRPDYQSSPNDNVIVQGIEGSDTSFGWVGYAFYKAEAERMKAIAVAGEDGTCVEPTDETIASGEYPLARDLFIYVSKASIAENPSVQAFVDFYMTDAGTQAVADAGYVQLTDEDWQATVDAWNAV
ncbi:MAG: phosphate ABC transporter substrate-binding protein PstS family protein [Acidimicrobiales bacterium]|nr:phosphate ABC transporter substrate-binding protein PstS family protein [Acidimicrobiales bacterium]